MQDCQECLQQVADAYMWDNQDKAPVDQALAFEAACLAVSGPSDPGMADDCRRLAQNIAADIPANIGKRAAK
jgi:hypothetical protein